MIANWHLIINETHRNYRNKFRCVLSLFQCLSDVFQQVLTVFKTDAEAYQGIIYLHLAPLFVGKADEDGAGRMNGERFAVKEIGGSSDHLQLVDETECSLF